MLIFDGSPTDATVLEKGVKAFHKVEKRALWKVRIATANQTRPDPSWVIFRLKTTEPRALDRVLRETTIRLSANRSSDLIGENGEKSSASTARFANTPMCIEVHISRA